MTSRMTRNEVDWLVERISEAIGPSGAPVFLHDCAAKVALEASFAKSLDEAFEVVEPILETIRVRLVELQDLAENRGTSWHIEVYGSESEWIRGSSFEDLSLDLVERGARIRRAFMSEVKKALKELSYQEFEAASTSVLRLLGCKDPTTSPQTDDGGIDFYGKLELKGRLNTPLPLGGIDARANVWLIGQAKHYPTRPIQPGVIRELVGSIELARTQSAIHSWDGLMLRAFDATKILIFTTGWFSSGSLNLLANTGALSMDGDQLATFLCDAGVGFINDSSEFSVSEFRNNLLGN